MTKIKVTYMIEWSTIVEIHDKEINDQKYAKFVASERLNADLEDRVFIISNNTEVKVIETQVV